MKNSSQIVYISTYPPRECGIATFTRDLIENFDDLFTKDEETEVIAMNIEGEKYNYPKKVIFEISQNNPSDYEAAATKLNNISEVKLVAIEHEFGIFGEHAGRNIAIFLDKIEKPIVITLHTILPNPSDEIREVMQKIIKRADRLVVMTGVSKSILEDVYNADPLKIKVIPHGIHPIAYSDGKVAKEKLNFQNKKIISTFGFLSRGKGIEYGIEAMSKIIIAHPDTLYLIIGETHPVVYKNEGESYREELVKQVERLGLGDNIIFVNKFLPTKDLLDYLEATDIYLSLSQNGDQAVSGTFTYALGAGRPVISTPFMQAKDTLTEELGKIIKFNDSDSIAEEVIKLLNDPGRLINMGKAAYFRTRRMTWPNVALSYMRVFTELAPEISQKEKVLPPIKLDHLKRLTNDFGIFQFAILDKPDPTSGYTLDDNARALIATSWHTNIYHEKSVTDLAHVYIKFLSKAINNTPYFANYFSSNRTATTERNNAENLEEANARAIWALSVAGTGDLPIEIKTVAANLFIKYHDKQEHISSPRAAGFYIKALAIWLQSFPDENKKTLLKKYADYLLDLFNRSSASDWMWFEEVLTYCNAILPEALLFAYKITNDDTYFSAAKKSLDFLISHSFEGDVCIPVGQGGWFKQGNKKHIFDQQPEEVSALVMTLKTMFDITNDPIYAEKAELAFNWFLGNNTLQQVVYYNATGGCYDGLGEKEINLNQGAESTIAYLLARLAIEKIVINLENK